MRPLPELSEDEIETGYFYWRYENYRFAGYDELIKPYLYKPKAVPPLGWLRACRLSLCLSLDAVAKQMNKTPQALLGLEKREAEGSIQLKHLEEVAVAMGCELIYAIRPKQNLPFSRVVWNQILPVAAKHPWMRVCDRHQRGRALAGIAAETMKKASFRQQQGWSRNRRSTTDRSAD